MKVVKLQLNVCRRDEHAKLAYTSLGKSVGERHFGFQVDSVVGIPYVHSNHLG